MVHLSPHVLTSQEMETFNRLKRLGLASDLRELQRSHDGGESEHISHGALELGCQLDGLIEQNSSFLRTARAAQQVHRHHYGHGVEPAGKNSKESTTGGYQVRSDHLERSV